jgi:DNA (cytosine-5)-methyltransferase 1
MIGIDLFAGSGGLSEGAKQAGIEVRFAVENEPHAATTYSCNHHNTRIFNDSIGKLKAVDINWLEHVDIVFGGPPCQGYSASNRRTRSSKNPDNWLFLEFLRIINITMPNWVLFENVTGMAEIEGGFFLKKLLKGLRDLNYTCSSWVLNAVDYGVPQTRKRLFVLGSSDGIPVRPPTPIMSKQITVKEAISDLPRLKNGASTNWMPYRCKAMSDYSKIMRNSDKKSPNHLVTKNSESIIKRYEHIPQGGNWQTIPNELMSNYKDKSRCHTRIYHRLNDEVPSVVIGNYRKNMLIHPTENRGLSVREAARLQSFHDSYEFQGSIGFQQQQVGDAVPPLLALSVFKAIKDADSNRY